MKQLDPKDFGLHPTTRLIETADNHICIIIDRKSRVIMADAKKILKKAQSISQKRTEAKVSLRCSGPICSKSVAFLQESGISID